MDPIDCGQSLLEPLAGAAAGERLAALAVRCRLVDGQVVGAMTRSFELVAGPSLCADACPLERQGEGREGTAGGSVEPRDHPTHLDQTEVLVGASVETTVGIATELAERLAREAKPLSIRLVRPQLAVMTIVVDSHDEPLGSVDLLLLAADRTLLRFYTCDEREQRCSGDDEHRRLSEFRDALVEQLRSLDLVTRPHRPLGFLASRRLLSE